MRKRSFIKIGLVGSLLAMGLTASGLKASAATDVTINTVGGYTEGAAVTFTSTANPSVYYSVAGADSWTQIDSKLIRQNDNGYRADILGLTEGNYDIKVSNGSFAQIAENVAVTADDRSGYAHFNNTSGIGAYNNDGTLKSGAVVVYVTDETKNTVTATIGGTEYTGLSAIIKAQKNASVPLDIRILDEIQTQQWTYKTHGTGSTEARMTNLDNTFVGVDWEVTSSKQDKSNSYYKIGEEDIISYGINSLTDTGIKYDADGNATTITGITHLDGLTNVVNWCREEADSGYKEYDSYFNELDVKTANNITVEGVGDSAGIFQWGFCFSQCNSIEVKNLEFSSYPEDAVGIQGGGKSNMDYHNFWIHNCTFNTGVNNWDVCYENDKTDGDGSTDFKFAYGLTISYCRYNKTHKTALIGSGSTSYQYDVTFHHNYYYKCGSRLPFTRNTNFHIYNCYYYGSTGTNMQINNTAYAFIEGCYFENTNKTFTTSGGGVIKLYNNVVNSSSSVSGSSIVYATSRDQAVTNTCTNKSETSGDSAAGTSYTSFDTDSTLFYYDTTTNKTDVTRMDDPNDIPTIIPDLAGSGLMTLTEYSGSTTDDSVKLALGYSVGTYTQDSVDYSAYRVVGKLTNVDDSYIAPATIQLVIATETKDGTKGSKTYNVTTLYKELTQNGTVIEKQEDGTYYFYFNIYGLTDAYDGYSFTVTANVNINNELLSKTLDKYTISLGEKETTYITFEEVTSDVTASTEYSNYTINATSEKTVKVSSLSSSLQFDLNGETITSGIALGGGGEIDYRNIEFEVTGNATITVYYNGVATRYLALYNSSFTSVEQATGTTGTSVVQNYTYSTVSAGTYYIASISSGINIYAIVIEYI